MVVIHSLLEHFLYDKTGLVLPKRCTLISRNGDRACVRLSRLWGSSSACESITSPSRLSLKYTYMKELKILYGNHRYVEG